MEFPNGAKLSADSLALFIFMPLRQYVLSYFIAINRSALQSYLHFLNLIRIDLIQISIDFTRISINLQRFSSKLLLCSDDLQLISDDLLLISSVSLLISNDLILIKINYSYSICKTPSWHYHYHNDIFNYL